MLGSEPARSQPTTAAVAAGRARGRRGRDRRVGVADFLEFLNGALHPDRDPREIRARFEEGLRRLVSARRVALRSGPAPHRMPQHEATRRLAVDVPNSPDGRTSMEVVFDAAAGPDAWDVQFLQTARYLASFVLELERCRLLVPAARPRPADTIPLVGSSAAITALRERIERVAVTDFTVLTRGSPAPAKNSSPVTFTTTAAARAGHSWRSIARRSSNRSSRRSSSASRTARRPE
jgi:hypothetical protein